MKVTASASVKPLIATPHSIPAYLTATYWWAYVHPNAIRLFERQWLVNLILWRNFGRLRDSAVDALDLTTGPVRALQVACVYGDLTQKILERSAPGSSLDVMDVVPAQLANLRRKLPRQLAANLIRCDSSKMQSDSGSYDRVLLFFLLHEMPEPVRRATLAHAFRVVKPGGRIVIIDYHRPLKRHPLYWPMVAILGALEPFAMDLWRNDIESYFPRRAPVASIGKTTMFGNLYQLLKIDVG
jgi:ubiquinone/menaquinone biosynthesis C-methylase UbiE